MEEEDKKKTSIFTFPSFDGSTIKERTVIFFATIVFFILFGYSMSWAFYSSNLFQEKCLDGRGRTCNDRGICLPDGCECDIGFSGKYCTITDIPGYDIESNTECSGRGVINPFMIVTPSCQLGWDNAECLRYNREQRTLLVEANFNELQVPGIVSVPTCKCEGVYGGLDCSSYLCPRDENLQVCGANSIKTVGPFFNHTTPNYNYGCQCQRPYSLLQPEYYNLFSEEAKFLLSTRYQGFLNGISCGQVFSSAFDDVFLFVTSADDAKCLCEEPYAGEICQLNACPSNPQNDLICSGNGDPQYGFAFDKRVREPICKNGTQYSRVINSCTPVADTIIPQFDSDVVESILPVCADPRNIRCGTGQCFELFSDPRQGCLDGFQQGTYDINVFGELMEANRCGNFSTAFDFTACFENKTAFENLFVENNTLIFEPGTNITVDLGSPLVFFDMEALTRVSSIKVTTFDGQEIVFPTQEPENLIPELIAGAFTYTLDSYNTFVQVEDAVTLEANSITESINDFWISPITGFNYSGEVIFNTSYDVMRIPGLYTFTALDSRIVTEPWDDTGGRPENGVLVKSLISDEYVKSSSGTTVLLFTCLNDPTTCAWYVDDVSQQLRTLDFQFYVCTAEVNNQTVPSVITSPCPRNYTEYGSDVDIRSWRTEILGNSESSTSVDVTQTYILEISGGVATSYPFTIGIADTNSSQAVQIAAPVFITIDMMNPNCACPVPSQFSNQSALNRVYFQQSGRDITSPNINELVVAKRFIDGATYFIRGQIIAFDIESQTMTVDPVREVDGSAFEVYFKNARSINRIELNDGIDDTDSLLAPARCSDGSRSNLIADIGYFDTTCNCTQSFPANVTNCQCNDGNNAFNCSMTAGQPPQCQLPANAPFEYELQALINNLSINRSCSCVIYENSVGSDTLDLVKRNATYATVEFGNQNAFPYLLDVHVENCTNTTDFTLTITNPLFVDFNVTVGYVLQFASQCRYELLVEYGDAFDVPFSEIAISVYGGFFESGQAVFNPYGFALENIEQPIVITTSSVQMNNTFWKSDGNIVNYLEYMYSRRYVVSHSTVAFINTGFTDLAGNEVPIPVELQASNDGLDWYLIGIYYAYGDYDRQEINLTSINSTSFSQFRLLSQGNFAISEWNLFTNQVCDCGDINLNIDYQSTNGLKSYQDYLDSIEFQLTNLDPQQVCIAINNCTVEVGGGLVDLARNGICNDDIYVANQFNRAQEEILVNRTFGNITDFAAKRVDNVNETLTLVQYTNGTFYSVETLLELASEYFINGYTIILNGTDMLAYYYVNPDTFEIYEALIGANYNPNRTVQFLINETDAIRTDEYLTPYVELSTSNVTCEAGFDFDDCGPSNRLIPNMAGYGCELNQTASDIYLDFQNKTGFFTNKTYTLTNFTEFEDPYTLHYFGVRLFLQKAVPMLSDCDLLTYDNPNATFLCKNGTYVQGPNQCVTEYENFGNGCVRQLDVVDTFEAYRCACDRGFAGDACQYRTTIPAIPEQFLSTPASEETVCGGPPPITERPPIVNMPVEEITPELLVEMNRRVTGNSAPKSALDVDYHRILYTFAPYGKRIKVRRVLKNGEITYSTCPFARRGENGTYNILYDDEASRDFITGEPTWKKYTLQDGSVVTYPWSSIVAYDDFGYRCPNGQCVGDRSECERSNELFPVCNNKGICNADGSCDCFTGWRTFVMNDVYTESLLPYADPTEWRYNDNWRHHSTAVCTARDCGGDTNPCLKPEGCRTGSPELDFSDKYIQCPNVDLCAPSLDDCISQVNLEPKIICSGNGILARKDFSEQEYCICGDPISDQIPISNITEETQLTPNGYGDPECTEYYATQQIIVWSTYDYENDQPYRSSVTGEELPGKYLGWNGNPIGADPEEYDEWAICCDRSKYPRLELCPIVPCSVNGETVCEQADKCINPLVYPCNGHGTPRRDGTCVCDTDVELGVGYTFDLNEYSEEGCYKFVQCAADETTGNICNYADQCTNPDLFIYPFPYEPYFEQQNFTAGADSRGENSNTNLLNLLSTGGDVYESNLFQAATQIALSVIQARNDLAGCVCNDDFEPFTRPYLVEPEHIYAINETWNPNFVTTYRMNVIRVFYQGAFIINIKNEFGTDICGTTIDLPLQTDEDWFDVDCGNTYQCNSFVGGPGYFIACGLDPLSQECIEYNQNLCSQAGDVYWPLDSVNFYSGCNREDAAGGCQCCTIIADVSPEPFSELTVTILENGTAVEPNLEILRYYAIGDETPPINREFKDLIDFTVGIDTNCSDERFFNQFFDADNSYSLPNDAPRFFEQTRRTYEQASARCEEVGSYLAVTENFNDPQDISAITRTCELLGTDQDICWVAARDRDVDEYTRETYFEDNCRQCFFDFSISSYPGTFFNSPPISGAVATGPIIDAINNYNLYASMLRDYPPRTTPNYVGRIFGESATIPFTAVDLGNLFARDGTIPYNYYTHPLQSFIPPDCTVVFERRYDNYLGRNYVASYSFPFTDFVTKLTWGQGVRLDIDENGRKREWQTVLWPCTYLPSAVNGQFCFTPGSVTANTIRRFKGHSGYFDAIRFVGGCPNAKVNFYPTSACSRQDFVLSSNNRNDMPDINSVFTLGDLNGWNLNTDSNREIYERIQREQLWCIKMFPGIGYSKVSLSIFSEQPTNTGSEGSDLLLGYDDTTYVPAFLRITRGEYVHPIIGRSFLEGQTIVDESRPVVFTGNPLEFNNDITSTFEVSTTPRCDECPKVINGDFAWDDKIFRTTTFFDQFGNEDTPNPQLFLYLNQYIKLAEIPTLFRQFLPFYIHQTTYIDPTLPQFVEYQIDECVVSSEQNLALSVCTSKVEHNFVCQYDFTKYVTQSGTDCTNCGFSGRVSGQPQPGVGCFEGYPLADPEQNPLASNITAAYLGGYLNVYIDSYYLGDPEVDYTNTSVITAYDLAWELWKNDVSTRQKSLSEGQQPSTDWVDLSLTNNFPVNCGNGMCATSRDFCDNAISDINNPMSPSDLPISLAAVPEDQSYIDTTCGVNIFLRDYVNITKDGPGQDQNQVKIVASNLNGVELQTLTDEPFDFLNNLKNPSKIKFNINETNTVFVQYSINCNDCIDPVILSVFIHTLSPGIVNVRKIFSADIIMDVSGNLASALIDFTVEQEGDDVIIGDQVLPEYVYQGVGYHIDGLPQSSSITLLNPIVTTNASRVACITRDLPEWVEARGRIKSSVPLNQCIFEGEDAGTCSCAFNMGGDACSYFTVNGRVCGGYGTEGAVRDGLVSNEEGAYISNGVFDCKTYNLGNVVYGTLVPDAISQYQEVFVESIPLDANRRQFITVENPNEDYYERADLEVECDLESADLPFAINSDQIQKALQQLDLPFYFNMNQDFENIDNPDQFITDDPNPTDLGTNVDCSIYPELCAAANFNNFLYGQTGNALTDGDTSTTFVNGGSPLIIEISPDAPIITKAYVWNPSVADGLDCSAGGICSLETGGVLEIYECRCPAYLMTIPAGYEADEIQLFDYFDDTRASIYDY